MGPEHGITTWRVEVLHILQQLLGEQAHFRIFRLEPNLQVIGGQVEQAQSSQEMPTSLTPTTVRQESDDVPTMLYLLGPVAEVLGPVLNGQIEDGANIALNKRHRQFDQITKLPTTPRILVEPLHYLLISMRQETVPIRTSMTRDELKLTTLFVKLTFIMVFEDLRSPRSHPVD